MPKPRAFTLIELLVVIGIIGVLIAILLPVISKARAAAMQTVCTARLRELTGATHQFQVEHKRFPEPPRDPSLAITGMPLPPAVPHHMTLSLINDLRPYFRESFLANNVPIGSLSPLFQCPFVEGLSEERGPFNAGYDTAYYYTGYAYLARLEEGSAILNPAISLIPQLPLGLSINLPAINLPTLLKKNRSSNARGTRNAPLWADDVHFTVTPSPCWTYWHRHRGSSAGAGPIPLTVKNTKPILGQNVAFSDGSVRFVPAANLNLDVSAPPIIDLNASFKVPGLYVWWF